MPTAVIEPKMQTRRAAPAGGRAVLRRICTMLALVGWAAVSLLSGASLPGMLGFARLVFCICCCRAGHWRIGWRPKAAVPR